MRKLAIVFLTLFMLLVSGCTDQPEQSDHPTVPEAPTQATEIQTVTEAVPTDAVEKATDAVEEATDAVSGATPTESGKCRTCGAPENQYDGYCYYCHPDHGFQCANCGYYWPEARPASGLCPDCEAAAQTVDAYTGATG